MACQAANDQDIKTAMPIVCLYLQIDSMTNVGFWKSQIPISHWNPWLSYFDLEPTEHQFNESDNKITM